MEKLLLVQKRSVLIPARHSNKATLTLFLKSWATLCSQVPLATTSATCASSSPIRSVNLYTEEFLFRCPNQTHNFVILRDSSFASRRISTCDACKMTLAQLGFSEC